MITDNEIPAFLAQAFASAPKGSFSLRQRQQAADISQFVDADLFGLYLLDKESYPRATLIAQPKEEMVREYEYYRGQDPLFHYLLRQGGAVEGVELLGEEQWFRNPIGQLLQRWQMQYTIQGAITNKGKVIGTLNFARAPDAGRFCAADTAKVAALCREVSALMEGSTGLGAEGETYSWPPAAFVTSPTTQKTAATLISGPSGEVQAPFTEQTQELGINPADLQQIIGANIHSLQSDTHQLIERTIFTGDKKSFSLTTLPMPGDTSQFITIIKGEEEVSTGNLPSLPPQEESGLGERTQQALDLLVRGYSNKLIAREMGVSENTVKDHIRRIYRHYGVSNRTQLTWQLGRK